MSVKVQPNPVQSLEIREANKMDAGAIASIYNQSIHHGRRTMDTEHWSDEFVSKQICSLDEREQLLVCDLVPTNRGKRAVVAWGVIKRYSQRPGYSMCCETSLYVDDRTQNRGVGQQLIDALAIRCVKLRYRHAVAKILAANVGSIRFHQRNGYEQVGVQNEIGMLNGRWEDVVIMQRLFREVTAPSPHHLQSIKDMP